MTREDLSRGEHYFISHIGFDLFLLLSDYVKKNGGVKKSAKRLDMSTWRIREILDMDGIGHMSLFDFISLVIKLGRVPNISVDIKL